MRDFKVGDEVVLKARVVGGFPMCTPGAGPGVSVRVERFPLLGTLDMSTRELDAMQPKPAEPPFAVGDFVQRAPASPLNPGDGALLVVSLDPLRFEYAGEQGTHPASRPINSYVKCDDQAACRRIHAIARVERAQAKVRKLAASCADHAKPMTHLEAWHTLKDMKDARAVLVDCHTPASDFVAWDGYTDQWGTHLIELAKRLTDAESARG